ncbi:hypothetical protein K469DRAFT_585945 [Zopfia rhizophila CBS 207.26]|uniref:SWI/SNF family DNA-dependent ATPase Ris1 n=1 Tax=Zopfia rhizophila CBS 207.26 TaxID=1314779 RepID=A0A6A6DXV6_9PEZI|nr:hypothetical protein K469DRAFT_585945 [Zopfia rhizophila CBS 207.26]
MKAEFDIQQLPIETQTVDLIDLTGDDDEFGSNAPANGQNDPFRELNFAFRPVVQNHQANSTQPVDAFNQEWMTKDELAQFLITPTPPSVDYVNDNFGQQPAINPSVNFSANFSANFPMAQPNLAEELFGRDDDESDRPMPYSAGEQPEALAKLIESIRPEDETPPELREPTPKAMSSELMEHQKLGLSWLKKMEEGHSRGGILADDMGLGKTIQALALILARPSEDPARKTTLIVAPVALMRQWEKEIERHVHPSHRLKVFVYHGSSGRNADFNRLRQYDVVLTTFGTLANEMKTKENRTEVTKELTAAEYPPIVRRSKDKLALIGSECVWYRVILDEAQCIKNRTTLTSKASNELQAQYRLCMTGTPMMNTVDELYPLLRFLQTKPYNDWARFSFDISKRIKDKQDWSKRIGLKRIQALLKSTMLRRTKDTIMDGEPICKIPPKHTGHQHVEFSDAESELYKALENQSVLKFNKYLRAGTVNNNYANVLVLLLRLRQACCHPHLIKDLGVQVSTEGISENELLDRAKMLAQEVVSRLREEEGFECPICFDGTENPTVFIPCGHTTCGECFQKLVDPARAIQEGNENRNAKCPHCRGPLNAKNITDYRHFCKVFCPEKLDESERSEDVGEDVGDSSDSDSDDEDEAEGDDLGGFVVPDDADDDYVGPASKVMRVEEATTEKKPGKGKGKAPAKPKQTLAQLKKESLRNAAAKRKYLRRLRKSWESSAKIEKTVELVTEIEKNDPTEKILIFSQFTSLLDLLEVPLQDRNFKYQRYDGSMKPNDRADAVYDFMENARTKIMLISLKAGNAGLNLNRASQVIILDPFWNPFIEDQAVDRAHRMRQEREVHVHRVLVPETVEDRICALQDRKREIINAALDENAGKSIARLGLRDLMFLFGSVDHL